MIKRELVEEERWIPVEQFNRVYALYQVLPGPEAHELCVYFGTLARGRLGGLLAGLGFMLPGFVLMFALSWLYLHYALHMDALAPLFAGVQAAVIALIVRAAHHIGRHALTDRWLVIIAIVSAGAALAGVHFLIGLALAGLIYEFIRRGRLALASVGALAWTVLAVCVWLAPDSGSLQTTTEAATLAGLATPGTLFGSGLRAGLLTFGGAYTVIPYLQHDAVEVGRWMTDAQFLDGLALSGILPAPLIIFATFVGFLGGGALGAVLLTAGVFLPAFGFTMLGHELLERLTGSQHLRAFLAGVTAGVIGLIAITTVELGRTAIDGWTTAALAAAALAMLMVWHAKFAVAVVVGLAGLAGWMLLSGSS